MNENTNSRETERSASGELDATSVSATTSQTSYLKPILIGVLSTIIGVVLIALFGGWLQSQKQEIIDTVSRQIKLSETVMREELKKEKKSRVILAATLLKSGVDIPTTLLTGLTDLKNSNSLKQLFINEISSTEAIAYIDYQKFTSKIDHMLPFIYAANINDHTALLAYSDRPPLNKIDFTSGIINASLENNEGKNINIPISVNQATNVFDLLQQDGIKASNVIIIPKG